MFPNRVLNLIRRFKRQALLSTDAKLMLQLLASTIYAEKHVRIECIEEVVSFLNAAVSKDLTTQIPAGARVLFAQTCIDTAFTLNVATKVGLGTAGNPDAFALSAAAVAKNTKTFSMPVEADSILAAATTVQLATCDNAGAAAGNWSSAGAIRVLLVYVVADVIQSAP